MDDQNQMGQGSAVPPHAKEEAKRGVKHARKTADDPRSTAGAMADEYRERGKEVWMTHSIAYAVFRTTASNMYAPTQRRLSLPRSESVSCWV
jgi:hypothetical protein